MELDDLRFRKSLEELKSLRPHLHYAADFCEASLNKTSQMRKKALEDAKAYIGKAVVTTVDHLGNVSANLESLLSFSLDEISGIELRIHCLKQRLLTCETYSQREGFSERLCNMPNRRHHRRYVTSGKVANSSEVMRARVTLSLASSCSIGFEFNALLPKIEGQHMLNRSGSTTSFRSHIQEENEMLEKLNKNTGESKRHKKLLVFPARRKAAAALLI